VFFEIFSRRQKAAAESPLLRKRAYAIQQPMRGNAPS
jgi:hypothetical protein